MNSNIISSKVQKLFLSFHKKKTLQTAFDDDKNETSNCIILSYYHVKLIYSLSLIWYDAFKSLFFLILIQLSLKKESENIEMSKMANSQLNSLYRSIYSQ